MNEATKALEMIDMRNRCGTDQVGLAADGLPLKRADRLNLGDQVLFANWDGVQVVRVISLQWEGEDVLMKLEAIGSDVGGSPWEVSTSPGNTFRVIA